MHAEQYRVKQVVGSDVPRLIGRAESLLNARHQAVAITRQMSFPPGSHVITPRRGFLHHGIYAGAGMVVHYAGSTHGLLSGPVEEIPIDQFTCGRAVWARCDTPAKFGRAEVIRRARSRVGENHYRLISNNCEHFCEWCLRGEPRSYQVEAWLELPRRALEGIGRFKSKIYKYLGTEETGNVEQS